MIINMFLNKITKIIKPIVFQNYMLKKTFHRSVTKFTWKQPFINDPIEKELQSDKKYLYGNNSDTALQYNCSLNIHCNSHPLRRSGIICTIGPASADVKILEGLMDAGMNIARLNFSHGTHDYHLKTVENIRKAVKSYSEKIGRNYPLAIALDTKGPEIRTGVLNGKDASKEIKLNKGDTLRLSTDKQYENKGSNKLVYVDYENITKILKENDRIYVDDGLILMKATKIGENYIDCIVENEGMLGSRKRINLPGVAVDLPAISEKDKADIQFAADNDLDMIFASFIRDRCAVTEIRNMLGERNKHMLIISKIENHQGIQNLQSIIKVSDGIMVARGDLGIDIPPEKVFLAQKSILAQCNIAGKPGICATQMLESMTKKPRATRAESSDVANAILDGADCVMLSGETAKGHFPIESVRTMDKICREAESAMWRKEFYHDMVASLAQRTSNDGQNIMQALRAVTAADNMSADVIIVIDQSGFIAHEIAIYRPRSIILLVTDNHRVARQCHLHRGILPVFYYPEIGECDVDFSNNWNKLRDYAIEFGKSLGIMKSRDTIVLVGKEGITVFCTL